MNTQALLIELLLSGFFAVACFKARDKSSVELRMAPRALFVLTSRIERLRQTRLQWCSIVMLLVLARLQQGAPLVAELTALAQFLVFMSLPTAKPATRVLRTH